MCKIFFAYSVDVLLCFCFIMVPFKMSLKGEDTDDYLCVAVAITLTELK